MTRTEFESKIKKILFGNSPRTRNVDYFSYSEKENCIHVVLSPTLISFYMINEISKLTESEDISIELETGYYGDQSFTLTVNDFYIEE